ncbi:MAG TPA: cytochrome c [Thermoanaerobaculia bacterium]|nr:cytochrome c [Thermoanaerobaculia bacterium]
MKRTLILTTILLIALAPVALAEDAAALFKGKCQACHGVNGAADSPMAKKLAVKPLGSADVQKQTDAQLTNVIAKGKAKMPAFEAKLSADQTKAVVALIRTWKK